MSDIPPTEPSSSTPPQPLGYGFIPPASGTFNWADFITFRTMLAVPTIMILFWIGVAWAVVVGLALMFKPGGMAGFCAGVSTIIVGPFIVRLYCEFMIVVFRINETLTEILATLRGRPPL